MRISTLLCTTFAFAALSTPISYAASSDWQDIGGGKARLVATKDPVTDKISGIVEVKLDAGWKTYWRSPGSSGIPPEFNFDASTGIAHPKISFPVPSWISLPDASFYGYKEKANFIFETNATDFDATLALDLLIGVCEEICIPATAQFTLSADQLNTTDAKSDIAIALSKAALPAQASSDLMISKMEVSDTGISGVISGTNLKGPVDVVIERKDQWISDPVQANLSQDGTWRFETKLPKSSNRKKSDHIKWHYSILQRSEESQEILTAVDGIYPASK